MDRQSCQIVLSARKDQTDQVRHEQAAKDGDRRVEKEVHQTATTDDVQQHRTDKKAGQGTPCMDPSREDAGGEQTGQAAAEQACELDGSMQGVL